MTAETSKRPVQGVICPACAHIDAIVEESYTRPWDSGDTIDVMVGGVISMVLISFGRTKKRFRCGRCSCQFSRAAGLFTKVVWWTVVAGIAMLITGITAAMVQSSSNISALSPISGVCTWLAANPLVSLVLVATLLLVMFFTAVIGHTNAATERRHLYNALLKRESASGELASDRAEPELPEKLPRFYRR